MPTNRARKTRGKKSRGSVADFIKYHCVLKFVGGYENPMPGVDPRDFWNEHKDEIMAEFMKQEREWGKRLARRPDYFFEDLEKEHPRLKTGEHTWHTPRTAAGAGNWETEEIFETDFEYLGRLDLLEEWERKFIASNQEDKQDSQATAEEAEAIE